MYRRRRCISHPPGAVFQARLLDNQDCVPIPSGMPSESSWRYVFPNAGLLGTETNSLAETSSMMGIGPGVCVMYTAVYGHDTRSRAAWR